MNDLSRSWQKFIRSTWPTYNGVKLEVVPGGYLLFGKTFTTLKEVDEYIEKGCTAISKSINRLKTNTK